MNEDLILYRRQKSRETLEDAHILFQIEEEKIKEWLASAEVFINEVDQVTQQEMSQPFL